MEKVSKVDDVEYCFLSCSVFLDASKYCGSVLKNGFVVVVVVAVVVVVGVAEKFLSYFQRI